jgi:trans-aconitate methyltransferase
MQLETAIRLIKGGIPQNKTQQVWADLGAGSGLFTRALSSLLAQGSTVHAVDKDAKVMTSLSVDPHVTLRKLKANFIDDELAIEPLDGMLMANALHFVPDKNLFLKRIIKKLRPRGRLVIIEYERHQPNPWVPHPITFEQLKKLGMDTGFTSVEKLEETPSVYGNGMIYSAVIS